MFHGKNPRMLRTARLTTMRLPAMNLWVPILVHEGNRRKVGVPKNRSVTQPGKIVTDSKTSRKKYRLRIPEKIGERRSRPVTVYTVGHSTRGLNDFIDLLEKYGVRQVVDVRTIPRSRKNPQFNKDTLPERLRTSHIKYKHLPGLGGLRHPRADSPNMAWRNNSFRGFADQMQTLEFRKSIRSLIDLAKKNATVIMCAEAVPWRCHRSLIADALTVRRIAVYHIISASSLRPHTITSFAKANGTHITYPG